jgi:tellurite resistance protein
MIWLSSSTIARLRDQLRARGERPSMVAGAPGAPGAGPVGDRANMTLDAAELMAATAEYGPLCEVMYLMMSADGKIGDEERSVLKGALKSLSNDSLASTTIDAMVDAAAQSVARSGREERMSEVAAQLREDVDRSEVAFVLAAAVAFADGAIADEENETLSDLADKLAIDEKRVEALLDTIEADVARHRSMSS